MPGGIETPASVTFSEVTSSGSTTIEAIEVGSPHCRRPTTRPVACSTTSTPPPFSTGRSPFASLDPASVADPVRAAAPSLRVWELDRSHDQQRPGRRPAVRRGDEACRRSESRFPTPARPRQPSMTGPQGTTSDTSASLDLLVRRHRRELRVRARRGSVRGVHLARRLLRPGRGCAHVRRPCHRRGGQHRRHAGQPDVDDRHQPRPVLRRRPGRPVERRGRHHQPGRQRQRRRRRRADLWREWSARRPGDRRHHRAHQRHHHLRRRGQPRGDRPRARRAAGHRRLGQLRLERRRHRCQRAQTSIDSGPDATTSDTSATLTFSSEAGASFECALDRRRSRRAPRPPPTPAWPRERTTSRSAPPTPPVTSTARPRSTAGPSRHRPTPPRPRRASTAGPARHDERHIGHADLLVRERVPASSAPSTAPPMRRAPRPPPTPAWPRVRTRSTSVPPTRRATPTPRRPAGRGRSTSTTTRPSTPTWATSRAPRATPSAWPPAPATPTATR